MAKRPVRPDDPKLGLPDLGGLTGPDSEFMSDWSESDLAEWLSDYAVPDGANEGGDAIEFDSALALLRNARQTILREKLIPVSEPLIQALLDGTIPLATKDLLTLGVLSPAWTVRLAVAVRRVREAPGDG